LASATTAASAAGSELRRLWALALALLLILLTLGWFFEIGKATRVVVDGAVRLPPIPASRAALEDETLVDDAVQMTPAFTIDEPTTLELTLSRSADEGWVGADIALIEEESGEIRQLGLATDVRASVGADQDAQRRSTVLIDRVVPGRYVIRIAPSWEPLEEPAPGRETTDAELAAPSAHLEVVEGRRSFRGLGLAAFLILLPPLFVTGRRALRPRSRRAG